MRSATIMSYALKRFKPVAVYALYSGGHDSLVSTHFAMSHGAREVIHVNTGIGIRQTREHVRETCREHGWPLRELHPPDLKYLDLILKYGFPGVAAHYLAYRHLKERALRQLVRETKRSWNDRVMLVTGVRKQESTRRMGYVKPVYRDGATVWVAPFYNHSKLQNNDYISAHGLKRSPVVDLLHMSGECLCGAFAHPGEFKEIELWFPEAAEEIRSLQRTAAAAGVKRCRWGWRDDGKARKRKPKSGPFMPLCAACPQKLESA